jgi:hypothetical protein
MLPDPPPQPERPEQPARQEIACVPRRFGVGTLLVVTGAYAALITALKALDAPTEVIVWTCLYLTGIGVAQMVSGPRKARIASIIVGSALLLTTFLALELYYHRYHGWPPLSAPDVCFGLACVVISAPLLGAMGGVLVAGVFLLMRYADALIHRAKHAEQDEEPEDDTVTR